MSDGHIDVFVGSTSSDLTHESREKDYREAVRKAILDLGLFPSMMENWAATGKPSAELCKQKVAEAEIYIGIYAHRYGWQPDGYDGKSITELEFDWAGEVINPRDGKPIPRLCFIMSDDHPWPKSLIEFDKQKELDAFKGRVKGFHSGFFTTPDDLARQVIGALATVVKERFGQTVTPYKCNLAPRPPDHFAGRAAILNTLLERLQTGSTVAVTALRAVGGMGKTTLAKALAHCGKDAGTFGVVLWAEVGQQWSEEKEKTILRGWANELAGKEFPTDWDTVRLATETRRVVEEAARTGCNEPILLIIDDVWPTSRDAANRLRAAVPDSARILITSRSREVAIDLDITESAILRLEQLSDDDGADMLGKFFDGKHDRETLKTLSHTLGGHPLSLQLAARQLRKTRNAGTVLKQLQDFIARGDSFKDLKLDGSDKKEDSVSVTLALTYDGLTPDQQRAFRLLGVLPIDLSAGRDHIAAIWETDAETTDTLLDTLLLEGLIDDADTGRFSQHRLLRAYARGLMSDDEWATVIVEHCYHVIVLADKLFEQQPEEWNAFCAEFPMIEATGSELVALVTDTDDPEEQDKMLAPPALLDLPESLAIVGGDFAWAVTNYVRRRATGANGQRWMWLGLQTARLTRSRERELLFLNQLGSWYQRRGDHQMALKHSEQMLLISKEHKNYKATAAALTSIGGAYFALGDKQRGLGYFEQALQIYLEVEDRGGEATARNNIGMTCKSLGNVERALDYLEQALRIRREVRDLSGEATTLNNIGGLYSDLGEKRRALDYLEQALPILQKIGDRLSEAEIYYNISVIHYALHDLDRKIEYLSSAVELAQQVEHPLVEKWRSELNFFLGERNSISEQQETDEEKLI